MAYKTYVLGPYKTKQLAIKYANKLGISDKKYYKRPSGYFVRYTLKNAKK
jgi:hypothetical protein